MSFTMTSVHAAPPHTLRPQKANMFLPRDSMVAGGSYTQRGRVGRTDEGVKRLLLRHLDPVPSPPRSPREKRGEIPAASPMLDVVEEASEDVELEAEQSPSSGPPAYMLHRDQTLASRDSLHARRRTKPELDSPSRIRHIAVLEVVKEDEPASFEPTSSFTFRQPSIHTPLTINRPSSS
ncbi:hypothetical protein SISNIDRAFT_485771 [Sistotremastrum niveocremeum HHB9708]|uniref:Uncharacterized protein n=1 Tax=Sistotremastrum niveocremeum HHB9708 TaxID=1314777 RepID=A0A164UTI2_9AGAM|nr:hypothetical protein SISNIDRAFT_485771 [Sistotremastrum niveocremeum HHB9708]